MCVRILKDFAELGELIGVFGANAGGQVCSWVCCEIGGSDPQAKMIWLQTWEGRHAPSAVKLL